MLLRPAANRVYAAAAAELVRSELAVANLAVLENRLRDLTRTPIGGVDYLTFGTERELAETDVAYLSRLSGAYALYARERDGAGELLRPVRLRRPDAFDEDLITIPKYAGKTNEQFTDLLLTVTLLSSASAPAMLTRRLRVLDPLCGRGTTLNQALVDGYDACGIDADRKDFEAYAEFLRTWLKRKRLPHTAAVTPLRRDGEALGRRLDVTAARTRSAFKAGDVARVSVACADTHHARRIFAAGYADVLVADLPYGVQHGSRDRADRLSRNPLSLVEAALPAWLEVLRPGGAVGLAWNAKLVARPDLAAVLAARGLEVADAAPYHGFAHRVDQAIHRDLIVARKP